MSNANNLKNGEATQFRTGEEQVEIARMGGIASGKARREKKTIQKILNDYLQTDISKDPQFAKIASKLGIQGDKSIKDVFTIVCMLNSVKSGNLGDLERLSKLLGEDKQNENADVLSKLDKVIGEVDKLAE